MPDDQSYSLPPTQSASLEVGQRVFRHYVLNRFLGRGALGAAWLVVHEGHGRELAMRFVPEAWLRDERAMAALRDAVVKLLDITHPNIVGVLDFVRDAQAAAIVARFVDGKTLSEKRAATEERFLPVSMLQSWLAQLCDALDFAWRRYNAIHGDLSPQNMLVTDADEFRIIDFGLARSLYDLPGPTGAPLITGTQAYLSPERARGLSITVTDDVYGLGASIYELLTSRPVFFRGNVLWQLESVVPPSMTERRAEFGLAGEPIPPEWEQVVAACLAKRREDRPRDIREVGERLGLLNPLTATEDAPVPVVLPRSPDLDAPAPGVYSLRSEHPVPEFPSSLQTVSIDSMNPNQPEADFEVTQDAVPPVSATSSTRSPVPDDESDQTVAATEPPPPKVPPMAEIKTTPPAPLAPSAPPPLPEAAAAVSVSPPPVAPPPLPPLPPTKKAGEIAAEPPTEPPARRVPPPPPVKPPPPSTPTPARGPVSNPLKWVIPAGAVAALVIIGVAVFALRPKGKTRLADQPIASPTPVASPPVVSTPEPVPPTPAPPPPTPAPVPSGVKEVTVSELASFANQGRIKDKLVLTGEFRVSSAIDRAVIARPTARDLSGAVRVSARFPQGTPIPAEGSTVIWTKNTGLLVREVRKGNDGQLNIEVEKER
jgi:serine/threonine protein kinase